ncbi:thioesterase domain-containing protein [Streptomyces caelestis]|uniref:thioesterase domain-containing protein n=1 Tax=Streptomyces caelestis TaxID=36816 RepID=UPI003665CF4C
MALLTVAARLRPVFDSAGAPGAARGPVLLAPGGAGPRLVCFPALSALSGPQEYARSGAGLRGPLPVSAVRHPGSGPGEARPATLDALVTAQAAAVRAAAGDGPSVLVGRPAGGWVAQAVAERLEAEGPAPLAVVLVDTCPRHDAPRADALRDDVGHAAPGGGVPPGRPGPAHRHGRVLRPPHRLEALAARLPPPSSYGPRTRCPARSPPRPGPGSAAHRSHRAGGPLHRAGGASPYRRARGPPLAGRSGPAHPRCPAPTGGPRRPADAGGGRPTPVVGRRRGAAARGGGGPVAARPLLAPAVRGAGSPSRHGPARPGKRRCSCALTAIDLLGSAVLPSAWWGPGGPPSTVAVRSGRTRGHGWHATGGTQGRIERA